ncbi:MAG TPA: Asp-tRNA(Asn)/Glu-tRNA(Gln) amidotransferase subunit GatC [Clostridiaceae bacterium]|nr:Asp-tRNA(Asn)/Glu-tRNA(Gln) amidotransferase subunit GatC [Clostridiaceae bacterium]
MTVVDVKTVRKIADMAAVFIEEKDLEAYAAQLNTIMEHMGKIMDLDTGDQEPMEHILPVKNVFRDDEVTNKNIKDELLKNASVKEDGYFKVPTVVE